MVEYSGHFARYGQGSYVRKTPQEDTIHFQSFAGGYFSGANRKNVPENTSPFAIDVEVTDADRLRRSPGTTLLEVFTTRTPNKFVVHGSLDFTAELVFFDPPYLGVKRLGDTDWANKGFIEDGWWAWTNFGGTLIFSDGDAVYARQVNDGTTIETLAEAPVAVTYESWASRVWAGGAIIDENFEQLGLVWSAANSDYTDWTGEGSGFELLLDAISAGDRIIRLKSMNLDLMAVFLRNSIWIVRRTGQLDRPGDPQPRVAGKGAVNHDVVQSTDKGVAYLSDMGVELFDGNTSTHVSAPIDADLLPLDYGAILEYSSSYDTIRNRYYLHDPRGTTWILDLNKLRWYRRSLNAIAGGMWPLQAEGMLVEGTPRMVFLGDQLDESTAPRAIAEEDQDSGENFGVPLTPIWTTKPVSGKKINDLITTRQFNIEYIGAADIEIWSPNIHGNYDLIISESLIPQTELEVADIHGLKAGRLSSIMLRIPEGDIEVSDLQAVVQEYGPRVAIGEGGIIGNFPDRTTLLDFPTGTPWFARGTPYGPEGPPMPEDWVILIILIDEFDYSFSVGGDDEPVVEPTHYVWDFGDGTTLTTTTPTVPAHTYPAPGTYEPKVTLMVNGWTWGNYLYGPLEVEEPAEPPAEPIDFVPDAGAGTGPTDAVLFGESITSFSDAHDSPTDDFIVDASGDSFGDWLGVGYTMVVDSLIPQTQWSILRSILRWNTAELTIAPTSGYVRLAPTYADTDPVGAAGNLLVRLYVLTRLPPSRQINDIVGGAYPNTDWDETGAASVPASNTVFTLAQIEAAVGSTLDFVLNAAGLAAVNLSGHTCFVLRCNYDVLEVDPDFVADGSYTTEAYFNSAEQVDDKPTLHLEFD